VAGGQRGASGNHLPDRIGIAILAKVFPPELVDRVVDEAEVREQRKRILPARVVVYLLLVMVMFPGSGYGQVWDKLVQGMEWARWFRGRTALGVQPSPAAITLARQRLGWQVMQQLLAAAARPSAAEEQDIARVAGMRLIAVDGICLEVPATRENGIEFGYPGQHAGPGRFPQVRVVGLGECGTWAVLGAELAPLDTGELPLARKLLTSLARDDLLLAGRDFLSHGLLEDVLAAKAHVLWRAGSGVDLPVLELLPDRTYLSRVADPAFRPMRREGGYPPAIPGIPVRVIEYSAASRNGSVLPEAFPLITDITDPSVLSADQAVGAYTRRWQLKTCFDELETSLRDGTAVVLRAKSPPLIRQEIYAMLCCYQAIRTLISHPGADLLGLLPTPGRSARSPCLGSGRSRTARCGGRPSPWPGR
jgi:Insertion element 4 transposase N-terminal